MTKNIIKDKKVNLALLGASRIASRVLPMIREVSDLDVMGVAASDPVRAAVFAQKHELPRVFSSYDDALTCAEVDAVYISVLNADHFSLCKKALLAGKHVLCEKPIVLTSSHAIELTELASKNHLTLLEGFMYRFHHDVNILQRAFSDGSLGELRSIHLSYCFDLGTLGTARGMRSQGGGALNDLGGYLIDFATFLLGHSEMPIIQAAAVMDQNDPESVDREFSAKLFYSNQITVTMDAAIDRPGSNLWEIRASGGSVGVLRFDPQGISNSKNETVAIGIDENSNARIKAIPFEGTPMDQFRFEFQNFADAIQGKTTPFITHEEMILKSRILESIRAQI